MYFVGGIHWDAGFVDLQEDELGVTRDLDDFTLMQYTGLKDKNGVEIYEGDILKSYEHDAVRYNHPYSVIEYGDWAGADEVYGYQFPHNGWDTERWLEVIGNIYENPELVKE